MRYIAIFHTKFHNLQENTYLHYLVNFVLPSDWEVLIFDALFEMEKKTY